MEILEVTSKEELKDFFRKKCKGSHKKFIAALQDIPEEKRSELTSAVEIEPNGSWANTIKALHEMVTGKKKPLTPETFTLNGTWERLTRPMNSTEFQALKESAKERGFISPVIVSQDGVLIDGYNRYHVWEELERGGANIELPFTVREFSSEEEIVQFKIASDRIRRHLQGLFDELKPALEILPQIRAQVEEQRIKGRKDTIEGKKQKGEDIQKSSEIVALETVGLPASKESSLKQLEYLEKHDPEGFEKAAQAVEPIAKLFSNAREKKAFELVSEHRSDLLPEVEAGNITIIEASQIVKQALKEQAEKEKCERQEREKEKKRKKDKKLESPVTPPVLTLPVVPPPQPPRKGGPGRPPKKKGPGLQHQVAVRIWGKFEEMKNSSMKPEEIIKELEIYLSDLIEELKENGR